MKVYKLSGNDMFFAHKAHGYKISTLCDEHRCALSLIRRNCAKLIVLDNRAQCDVRIVELEEYERLLLDILGKEVTLSNSDISSYLDRVTIEIDYSTFKHYMNIYERKKWSFRLKKKSRMLNSSTAELVEYDYEDQSEYYNSIEDMYMFGSDYMLLKGNDIARYIAINPDNFEGFIKQDGI